MEQQGRKNNIVSHTFKYVEINSEYVIIPEEMMDDCEDLFPGKIILSGEIQVKIPFWSDMYEIERRSKGYSRKITKDNPFGVKRLVYLPEKLKYWKIKTLCHAIVEHDGTVNNITKDFVENLDISFSQLILRKVDAAIASANLEGLPKEDGDKLSYDCYNYFSKIKKSAKDPKIEVPEPPAIVVLMKLSKMLGLGFDEIRNLSKKDIDEIFIAKQQENLCENPALLGQGAKIPLDPKLLKNTEGSLMRDKKRKVREAAKEDNKPLPKLYPKKKA